MSHDIAKINGKAAMAYVGDSPWHRLGTEMHGFPNVLTAMKAASLDWEVNLEPVYLRSRHPGRTTSLRHESDWAANKVPGCNAVVRDVDGFVLATVGDKYEPVQNREAFEVLDTAVEQFGVHIETCGALGKGDRVWMLAKLPEAIEPVPGDKVEGYFLITTGHNGWTSYEARLTPVRVVCSNTLAVAKTKGEQVVKLRHTKSDVEKLDMVQHMVTDLVANLQEQGKVYTTLAQTKLSTKEINAYLDTVLGIQPNAELKPAAEERRQKVHQLAKNGTGVKLAPNTAWAAYNAITEYVDHLIRDNAKADVTKAAADKAAIFGSGAKLKDKALTLARELVVVR